LIYIPNWEYEYSMELVKIYQCLSDVTRLRLLHVLSQGPLCVCDFQTVLAEPQVKISKHLGYLRTRGLVEATRRGNWMIYALPARPSAELRANLACLQDCVAEDPRFRRDLNRLHRLESSCAVGKAVAAPAAATGRRRCC